MKKQLLLALACFCMLCAFSCKNSSTPEPEDNTPKKLKLLTRTVSSRKLAPNEPGYGNTADGYQTTFITYSYNDKKQLIAVKNGTAETYYWYDDLGRVSRVTNSSGNTDLSFSYEGSKVKTVTSKVPSQYGDRFLIYTYAYTGDNITGVAQSEDGQRGSTNTFTYPGAGVVKQSVTDVTYPLELEFKYDDKKTNLHNATAKYIINFPLGPFNDHNLVSRSQRYTTLNSTTEASYVYTYDEDGYPKTMVSTAKSSQSTSVSEVRFTYEYTEM